MTPTKISKKMSSQYENVDARPVKSFFVSMLTRDISLEDAILDLLDNCVDGIIRMGKNSGGTSPYLGFSASIEFDNHSFTIQDNCGGIPWNLHAYAFRLGKPPDAEKSPKGSVGTYGIGMKRAIFKIGHRCKITTRSGNDEYEVEISEDWIEDRPESADNWEFPVSPCKGKLKEDGTRIRIEKLHQGIASRFGRDSASFVNDLREKISTHYAFIIGKGFEVKINGKIVEGQPTRLVFVDDKKLKAAIRPFIYRDTFDDVEVFLAVGFTRPIPSQDQLDSQQEGTRYSAMDSGWTVVCNERAVLYCDKSIETGWGEAGVPSFHNQFIAISGIVEFSGSPSKLPTTTTKRGIDHSSILYLQVKNKMREGMKIFTNYTNDWRHDLKESKRQIEIGKPLEFHELREKTKSLKMAPVRRGQGQQYKPSLPIPKTRSNRAKISFVRERTEVEKIGEYLLDDPNAKPNEVGIACFDRILEESDR